MKAQYIMRFIILIISAVVISSCYSLESENYGTLNKGNFFKDDNDAIIATNSVYAKIGSRNRLSSLLYSIIDDCNLQTDEMDHLLGEPYPTIKNWAHTVTFEEFTRHYEPIVQQVAFCTQTLEEVKCIPMRNSELKARLLAEIRTMRCFYLLLGTSLYNGIPMYVDPEDVKTDKEVYLPRAETEQIAAYIHNEITDVADDMPDRYEKGSDNWGRATRAMAYMIDMKAMMMVGRWDDAEKSARMITEGLRFKHSLVRTAYEDVFKITNEQNDEIIWAVSISATYMVSNPWITYVMPPDYPKANKRCQAWHNYGTPWEFYDTFEEGDQRRARLVGSYISTTDGTERNRDNLPLAIPFKYDEDMNSSGASHGHDNIYYRYSDVLLSLAECIYRKAGNYNDPEIFTLINDVRGRAKVSSKSSSDFSDNEEFEAFLLAERGRELYIEGHRRDDLIRFGKIMEHAKKMNPNAQEFQIYWPIPQKVITQSGGIVKQNPYK